MSQLAPIAFSSMPPVLPSNIAALAEQSFTDAFSGFSSGLRWVRHTNNGFELRRGGSTEDTIMVNAFVAEVVEELEDEPLVEALEEVISNWLEKHA